MNNVDDWSEMPDASGVYFVMKNETGEKYIGSSVNMQSRVRVHQNCIRRGDHQTPKIVEAFPPGTSVSFGVIEFCSENKLLVFERYWIAKLEPKLNTLLYFPKRQRRDGELVPSASEIGAKGGSATAAKLTAAQRSESARRASIARWNKVK